MRIAYFDCFSGISGDMVLGALVNAGLDPALLRNELAKLDLPDISIDFEPAVKHAISATQAAVRCAAEPIAASEEHHLHLEEMDVQPPPAQGHAPHHLEGILSTIRHSRLDEEVKTTSARVFQRLAEAEAQVHGLPPEKVHLHEAGALDAVVDIVAAVAGLQLLNVDQVYASPLRFGTGFVQCAHGRYPVPVPGVLALC